jgi:phage baseplate assembly protein W
MTTRSDRFTQLGLKQESFSDFLNNFDAHPISKTLARTVNEASVGQSIKNLILTNLGERLFQPTIGSDIYRSLFEPADVITQNHIIDSVKRTINNNEPRAVLLDVSVALGTNDSLIVQIVFSLINNINRPLSLEVILKRVR